MTPREAIDRIAALIRDDHLFEHMGQEVMYVDEVRAVLAEVSPEPGGDPYCGRPSGGERCGVCGSRQSCYPEPGGVLDRDQARDVLLARLPSAARHFIDGILDALEPCVRPAVIDRDALSTILRSYGVDGDALDEALDRIEALVRLAPAGVTLTPGSEQARVVQWALRRAVEHAGSDDVRATAVAIDRAIGEATS